MFKKSLIMALVALVVGGGSYFVTSEVLSPCARLDRICARGTQGGNLEIWGACVGATLHGARNSQGKCQRVLDVIAAKRNK